MKRFLIAAVAIASVSSAFAGEIVSSSNVIGEGSLDSPVTSALNWDSVDIQLFGGAAYDGGLLVQDGSSAFFADGAPNSFVFADGTSTSGGPLATGATATDTTVAMSDTGSMIAVSISSADRQALVGAGVSGPGGPFTTWRIDVGAGAHPDSIEWTGAGTINVLSSGFTAFNAAGSAIGTFALAVDASDSTQVGGVGVVGLGGGDIAGFDLAELVVFWEYEVVPEPTALALFGMGVLALVRRRR